MAKLLIDFHAAEPERASLGPKTLPAARATLGLPPADADALGSDSPGGLIARGVRRLRRAGAIADPSREVDASFVALVMVAIAAVVVATFLGEAWLATVTAAIGALALSSGLLELLFEDAADATTKQAAKSAKAQARTLTLPAAMGAAALIAVRAKRPEWEAVLYGCIGLGAPVLAALLLARRRAELTLALLVAVVLVALSALGTVLLVRLVIR